MGQGGSHTIGWRGPPWPRHHVVWGPQEPTDIALATINCLPREKPKDPSQKPRKVPEPPPPSTLTQEGSESLPGTLPERGIITGGLFITMPASGVICE